MTRKTIPNDIIPFEAGDLILIPVNEDGSEGTARRTYGGFMISLESNTSRAEEEVEKGTGSNLTLPQSEIQTWTLTVNAQNQEFDATIAGRDIKFGSGVGLEHLDAKIVKTGEVGSEVYSYTFETENKPVKDEDEMYLVSVSDKNGYSLDDVSGTSETLTVGQFKYDTDTGILSVSADYENELLTILYNTSVTEMATTSASETLQSKTFRVIALSKVQSATGGVKLRRKMTIDRANITGDITDTPNQKGLNTNKTYTIASQDPRPTRKRYTDSIYRIKE